MAPSRHGAAGRDASPPRFASRLGRISLISGLCPARCRISAIPLSETQCCSVIGLRPATRLFQYEPPHVQRSDATAEFCAAAAHGLAAGHPAACRPALGRDRPDAARYRRRDAACPDARLARRPGLVRSPSMAGRARLRVALVAVDRCRPCRHVVALPPVRRPSIGRAADAHRVADAVAPAHHGGHRGDRLAPCRPRGRAARAAARGRRFAGLSPVPARPRRSSQCADRPHGADRRGDRVVGPHPLGGLRRRGRHRPRARDRARMPALSDGLRGGVRGALRVRPRWRARGRRLRAHARGRLHRRLLGDRRAGPLDGRRLRHDRDQLGCAGGDRRPRARGRGAVRARARGAAPCLRRCRRRRRRGAVSHDRAALPRRALRDDGPRGVADLACACARDGAAHPAVRQKPTDAIAIATFPVAALIAAVALLRDAPLRRDFGFLAAAAAFVAAFVTTLAAIKAYSYATWLGMPTGRRARRCICSHGCA